ncbi:MAG: MCE family protein [Gammaproteobacteria bacterium]|jgi:ABC-type transporter Mla subunit MlaD|nr:MCE family protein [Gammaproteobacteria bacterium]MBT5202478.1 MCE family protein [Gammaproteobacteria bacterium]MBT5601902.1 MCE family protein [Gammaproteobacteria bacterium]MBT6246616.1 MCE family protein [Gammaproteobacteria bacterium]
MPTTAYRPFEVSSKDKIVGLFVIGAFLILLLGFIIPLIKDLAVDNRLSFHTIIERTYGIAPEATVSLRGVNIGSVTKVELNEEGMVRVELALSEQYLSFYTRTSRLSVDSELGVNSILTGSGLILHPGRPGESTLTEAAFIPTDIPQGFSSMLEELDLTQLADQISTIVNSLESISMGFVDNQDKLYRSLENFEMATQRLAEVSEEMPQIFTAIEASLASLESTLQGINLIVDNSSDDLALTISNTAKLTQQATITLREAKELLETGQPALELLPFVLETTDNTLRSVDQLSEQMSRSWLFGARKNNKDEPEIVEDDIMTRVEKARAKRNSENSQSTQSTTEDVP